MKLLKYGLIALVVLSLRIVPAFAQETEEEMLRDLGVIAAYAEGNLALNDIKRQNDPLQQLKRFFVESKLPLTSAEERRLKTAIDAAVKSLQDAKDEPSVRRANQTFTKTMFAVLTPPQQTALSRYMNQQIMMRGGFPALKLTLENAHTPLTDDQETQISKLYQQYSQQSEQLTQAANGNPGRDKLDKLESETLQNVVRLLLQPNAGPLPRHDYAP